MPAITPVVPGAIFPLEEGPCTWPLDLSCVADWETFPPAVQSAATAWATYILWSLTGRRYGPCSITIRPCGPRCIGPNGYLGGGVMYERRFDCDETQFRDSCDQWYPEITFSLAF